MTQSSQTTGQVASSQWGVFAWLLLLIVALAILFGVYIWRRGQKMAGEHVFRASRMSRGNRIFPAQVAITPSSITLYRPQLIGKLEESIHLAHVASVRIDTGVMFADVYIETSGGQSPIVCHGHLKGDVARMKKLIEEYQSGYYRTSKIDR
jgi:hypothetical protein